MKLWVTMEIDLFKEYLHGIVDATVFLKSRRLDYYFLFFLIIIQP